MNKNTPSTLDVLTSINAIDSLEAELISTTLSIENATKQEWIELKRKFVRVYPNFFTAIIMQRMKLSKTEERLLMLEKMRMKTGDIAVILGVLPESIYTTRYRLRKKINAS